MSSGERFREIMATNESTCHLLALPAELRLRIYEAVLSPGVLCLTRTDTKRYAVSPAISPLLLATCRQVYNEASKLLYFDNEITLIVDVHDTFAPVINESRLPQRSLEKLQHVCFICDATANFQASYEDVDFTPLSALVSLKTLRLCMLFSSSPRITTEMLPGSVLALTAQILQRVPASTRIICELESGGPQQKLAADVRFKAVERHGRGRAGRSFGGNAGGISVRVISTVAPRMIREAVDSVQAVDGFRGADSGTGSDVFAGHRAELKGFAWRS